jgi:Cysteine rich repeat
MHQLPSPKKAVLSAACFLFASAAFAQATPPPGGAPPPGRGACRADAAALCPNVGRGDHHAVFQCLESQQDKLSAACKSELNEMRAHQEANKEACKPDVEKFCSGIAPGGGRIMQCLKQHESELSDACKAAEAKHHGPPPAQPKQ